MFSAVTCVYVQDGIGEGEFKMLAPEELLVNDIDHLQTLVRERKDEERAPRREKKDGRDKKAKRGSGAGPSGPPAVEDALEVAPSSVLTLTGHEAQVYLCAWSPSEPLLASG